MMKNLCPLFHLSIYGNPSRDQPDFGMGWSWEGVLGST